MTGSISLPTKTLFYSIHKRLYTYLSLQAPRSLFPLITCLDLNKGGLASPFDEQFSTPFPFLVSRLELVGPWFKSTISL